MEKVEHVVEKKVVMGVSGVTEAHDEDEDFVVPEPVVKAAPKAGDRRYGDRKTVNADGSVSYGTKADGTPRKRPGRPAKSV